MARIARIVAVGYPHHVIQRGNYKQKIFIDNADRLKYLSYIQKYSDKDGLIILAYCLMDNHVHFVVVPEKKTSLAKTFNTAHMCYSQYFNKMIEGKGHLWQNRFFSCVLDDAHLLAAVRYIERNPVRAKLVTKPWDWEWSSAKFHIGEDDKLLKMGDLFKYIDMPKRSWKDFIDTKDDEKMVSAIKKSTISGWPAGDKNFLEKLEKGLKKKLTPLPKGRPKNGDSAYFPSGA